MEESQSDIASELLAVDYATELQQIILASIISQYDDEKLTADRMNYVLSRIQDEFMAGEYFLIWQVLDKSFIKTGSIPSPSAFEELLEGSHKMELSEKADYAHKYTLLSEQEIGITAFRIAVMRLKERWRDDQLSEVLGTAQRVHVQGAIVDKEKLSGFEDSISYLHRKLPHIERLSSEEELAEGYINDETSSFLRDYLDAKGGRTMGILTGFDELDRLTHGIQEGELWLVAGFTSEGKSKVCYNIGYTAAFLQGKNVLYGTNEATRRQVRANIYCRHSHHPKFGLVGGLRYNDLKWGILSKEHEEVLKHIVVDLSSKDYGRMFTFQIPARVTPDYLREVIYNQKRQHQIDLVIIDYLELMGSSGKRSSRREELDDVLVSTKRLTVELNIPIVSPWQISRAAWLDAQKTGLYTKAALSDTSQAEKTPDLVFSILAVDDAPTQLKCQVLKYRDGELMQFILDKDFATSYVGSGTNQQDMLRQIQ